MAFILHLIDSLDVSTVKAAEAFISGPGGKPSDPNPKLSKFVQTITATYPDLSEEDLDGDDDRNVWEEGLPNGLMFGRAFHRPERRPDG